MQTPLSQIVPLGQTLPHSPQFCSSVFGLTQMVLVPVSSGQHSRAPQHGSGAPGGGGGQVRPTRRQQVPLRQRVSSAGVSQQSASITQPSPTSQQMPSSQTPPQQTWVSGLQNAFPQATTHWPLALQVCPVGQVPQLPPQPLSPHSRPWQFGMQHNPRASHCVVPSGQQVGAPAASRQQIEFWQFGP
jgi:hypothetical protein